MIEYLLVVVVSVIIIGALVEKMFKPLSGFLGSMMGSYVECLLETGELPRLSADAEEATGECSIELMEKGPEVVSEEKKKSGKEDEGDDDKIDDSQKNRRNARRSSGGGGGVNLRSSSRTPFRVGGGQIASTGLDGVRSGGGLDLGQEQSGGGYWGGGGGVAQRQRRREVAFGGWYSEEIAKKEKSKEKGRLAVPAAEGAQGGSSSPRKLAMQAPQSDEKRMKDFEVQTLGISDIIKYLLIAAIVIIIIALIGGQVAQLSKSWEKGE